jgi:ABC-2 type transport system permease protein
MLVKVLDINNDRELLLKLPVSSRQIFVSKIVVAYMYELIFAAVVLAPLLLAFGITSGMAVGFYFLIPFAILFVPVLPFFVACLILLPVIKVVQYLRTRSNLTTLLYLIGLVALVYVYMQIVYGAVFAIAGDGVNDLLYTNSREITLWAKFLYPPKMFADLFNTAWWVVLINIVVVLVVSAAMIAGSYFIAGAQYKKIYMDERVTTSAPAKKSIFKRTLPTFAVLFKDSKNIFRSSNYTFQFLLVIVITPLFVYFCNRIAGFSVYQSIKTIAARGEDSSEMVFGVSLLVILILIPLASAFAASNISREGHNIYHTKLIPVSFRKQLYIKTLIVFVPLLLSVAVSCFLTMTTYTMPDGFETAGMNITEVLTLLSISGCMAYGYICLGCYLDLQKPLCNQVGSGELTKSTSYTNLIMGLGVVVGVVFGLLAMLSGYADILELPLEIETVKTALLIFSAVFALVFALLLHIDGPRRYYRLEQ